MLRRPALFIPVVCCLLAGCAQEPPFARLDYRYHQRGLVRVCYNPQVQKREEARKIADELCARLDRMAEFQSEEPVECTWNSPAQMTYVCVPRPGENPAPLSPHTNPLRREQSGSQK